MSHYYPEIPAVWTLNGAEYFLNFHNDGKNKNYVLYHLAGPRNVKTFPAVYNKPLLLEYMEMKGYKQKEAA
jgi:hypothetical protein